MNECLLQLALSFGESSDRRGTITSHVDIAVDRRPLDGRRNFEFVKPGGADLMRSVFQYMDTLRPSDSQSKFFARLAKMIADSRDDKAISRGG